ncbi:galactose-3-O-sulfotransferase 2-like [Mercenaria mercenaria]|uniref:galactose-3-O-sulfotransferase 2-like n=1 Tax=Mercenaria mercenaria TaxID=6596 RepID=UPI00234EFC93|nr:galactose-3-O-sulfotransferase 2-like [Mercenaria mercenaria]
MLQKANKQLLCKITFWVNGLCVLFFINALMTDMFGVRNTISRSTTDSMLLSTTNSNSSSATNKRSAKDSKPSLAVDARSPTDTKPSLTKNVRAPTDAQSPTDTKHSLATDTFSRRNKTTHIAFLKVHKAGSTTIQNMLFRFGMKHHLNIILPFSNNQLKTKAKEMPITAGQHNDIFALHTTYNKDFFDSLLPADYVNIGIVREPLSRMISAAYYHRDVYQVKYLRQVPRANFIHNLVNYPEKYDRVIFSQTRNTMARDFGFSAKWEQTDEKTIKKYLDELNSQFLFVMIMEKIDESLVFLRRLLNWSLADILYLKTNEHKHAPVILNKTEQAKLRRTSSFDFDIYEYFTKIFNEKINGVSPDFWEEVTYFKELIQGVSKFCHDPKNLEAEGKLLEVKPTKWDNSFHVSSSDCKWMSMKELPFIEKLRNRHRRRHNLK